MSLKNNINIFRNSDLNIALFLGICFAFINFYLSSLIPDFIIKDWNRVDVWFQGDLPRVFAVMTSTDTFHHARSNTHPIFSLIAYPLTSLIIRAFDLDPLYAIKIFISFISLLWISSLFILLRNLGCRLFDAVTFSVLAAVSASSIFWFTVPETFSFGSLTIILALILASRAVYTYIPSSWYLLTNILTLSITSTNWIVGIITTLVNVKFKKAAALLAYAFGIVTVLWGIQKIIFHKSVFFLDVIEDKEYLLKEEAGGPIFSFISFFYHTLIMPVYKLADQMQRPELLNMLTQLAPAGSGSVYGNIATILWTFLFLFGCWSCFTLKNNLKFRLVLGLSLLAQLGLHLFYGDETFLYSLHFLPLLIVCAALACLTKFRLLSLILALSLIPLLAVHNLMQFNNAVDYIKTSGFGHDQININKQDRPHDFWPRNHGHILLGLPTSIAENKAYYEPGGSFSPSVGSFGVSIWVLDSTGKVLTTSDLIPLAELQQYLKTSLNSPIPTINVKTNYYDATWSLLENSSWQLSLTQNNSNFNLALVIRSVGPAGGPIYDIEKTTSGLLINNRWILSTPATLSSIILGDEQKNSLSADNNDSLPSWHSRLGWGFAKIKLNDKNNTLVISDNKLIHSLPIKTSHSKIQLNLPNQNFIDSLYAQIDHLKMGIIGNETRPGDPTHYAINWQKDACYIITALAKAGEIELAKKLVINIAENDYFGGFGVEADAPGLALWTLNELSLRFNDKNFDDFILHHMKRKIHLINEMLLAKKNVLHASNGDIIPQLDDAFYRDIATVALPAKNGLAVGKIDRFFFPIFYVNAINYLGLNSAQDFFKRTGNKESLHLVDIKQLIQLKDDINQEFISTKEVNDPNNYAVGLWPTQVLSGNIELYREKLFNRWEKTRNNQNDFKYRPSDPSIYLGEAHQWLFLNEIEKVWVTLNWFFKNQSSPGLFTWWENITPKNEVSNWVKYRGWTNNKEVTPQYRASAQMLHLQLDMLGYLKNDNTQLIVGAGIPKEWLSHAMSVKGLPLPNRTIDWHWDGKTMVVTIYGKTIPVTLGSSFNINTPITINVVDHE